jgi:hypothetical protein
MRKVLLISRSFPPTSHVSVERAAKLAKYLPEFGWRPTVLTGRRGPAGLPEDPGLLDQLAGIDVIRTRAPEFSLFYRSGRRREGSGPVRSAPRRGAWHPKAWLVPDSQLLWFPFAVRAALRKARIAGWDAVVATTFPPTSILIAHTIAGRMGIPYVVDFRDSWTAYHAAPRRPALLAALERRLEERMIRDAAAVVAVVPHIVEHAFARLSPDERPPLTILQNGYDEDDFTGVPPAELPPFSIVHTGQMRRAPEALWAALSHALRVRPELRGRLHLWQVGFVDGRANGGLSAAPEGVVVHHVPPVPLRDSIAYMLGADLLLVEEFQSIMPSKTLQYLRSGRPILAVLDQGGMIREVLETVPQAFLVRSHEAAGAGDLIADIAGRPRVPSIEPSPAVTAYSRREIARRFAAVLDHAVQRRETQSRVD